jgi:hypothetical protein
MKPKSSLLSAQDIAFGLNSEKPRTYPHTSLQNLRYFLYQPVKSEACSLYK